ncbi:helix-turn-helix domain-containing protein [Pantoea ananatis]|uniref:helix-turn-helix domain-containing protein n=1 Tax=Pantoea ananas TaxID=553 RepID=UPI0021E9541C|nr:helix-turn-helix domain-containing protein [Pantoea ananatis]MCW0307111.1 HTH-type transcriptional activator RhaS [Pantoea ananatis]MCW0339110.1 HTH-type transcriptional activator RhaS [Pantoea ananatis]MCW0357304.1 HTH-type transcriptional activator RhaS [Pantoea ananatis]MCW0361927.1 HTH-type transcriptional activator RhaS [Pantoea ananatis]MCW1774730.1 helix-turn-helix domain-containing protein [Pantoea ananatis]
MNGFISDLILWIEKNLDNNINIDSVAKKSGYSKWHLQRLFSRHNGISLASYIRKRKLSEAALLLKMTKMPIIDIAERYDFSSQQAFTRAFASQFNFSPSRYRSSLYWSFHGFYASSKCSGYLPSIKEVEFQPPSNTSSGCNHIYLNLLIDNELCYFGQWGRVSNEIRKELSKKNTVWIAEVVEPSELYGFVEIQSFIYKTENVFSADFKISDNHSCNSYLQFDFICNYNELHKKRHDVYTKFLSKEKKTRGLGRDFIKITSIEGECTSNQLLSGSYFIPVVRS